MAGAAALGARSAAAAGPDPAATKTILTSVGSDGAAATAPNARPAIAENGRYVAFQSQATLNVSGTVVPPPPPIQAPEALAPVPNWRVYVRDQIGNTTSLLSNPATGSATAPTISADGKLVSYLLDNGTENNVFVVNRQATGKGAVDTPPNLSVAPVTGTSKDLQFERIPGCSSGIGNPAAIRTTPCGPKLSADGSTLVYPAQLSPVSPALSITEENSDFDTIVGNVVDFGSFLGETDFTPADDIQYTVQGNQSVDFSGASATAPFSVSSSTCDTTIQPQGTCDVNVAFDDEVCSGGDTALVTGTLQTDAATPDGQSNLTLVGYCGNVGIPEQGPAGCAAPPKGLSLVSAPNPVLDNDHEDFLSDLGPAVIGQPFVAQVQFTSSATSTPQLVSSDCGFQLVSPATVGQPAGPPVTCTLDGEDGESCAAYVLVTPSLLDTDAATQVGTDLAAMVADGEVQTYLTVTGVDNIIVARHDETGTGNFAASPSTAVSVDAHGNVMHDASQPSVSATGRYVAFTAPVPAGQAGAQAAGATSVWRHDTDAAGNLTFHPGPTIMVSCLPGGSSGGCKAAADADSPSMSGDGSQVAFATVVTGGPGQVYARNVTAGSTVLVSAAGSAPGTGGNKNSYAPAISQDGSTVAYISTATNLAAKATPDDAANLYVRTLPPAGPAQSELVSPTGASLPARDDIALPDVDGHGGLITFQTSQRLLPAAPRAVTSVYTFEREPSLTFHPAPVSFGTMMQGAQPGTVSVTVTDTGPGPGLVTSGTTTQPFGTGIGACAGAVLDDGGSCILTVSLTPQNTGTDNGSLTITVTDPLGSPLTFSVPITATVVPEAASLTLKPSVAPPGQVTDVTGSGFIPGQKVTLSWDHGLGQVSVVALATGRLTAVMVIFPDDFTGPRVLQAKDASSQVLATVKFLAQQPSLEPPFSSASAPG